MFNLKKKITRKKTLFILLIACFSATLFSQNLVSTEPSNRNMIMEEFTGKNCQFCPDGHKRAQNLMNANPDRVFAINVHQGGFAAGSPNYTTQYGNALASQAGMGKSGTGYPAGTVNRQAFEGEPLMGSSYFLYDRTRWASCVSKGLAEPSCLNIAAKGNIDTLTRKLVLYVEVYYTGDAVEETNKLTVAMLQNEILGPQDGGSTWYPEMMLNGLYRHQHMLRSYVTGTQWGMDITPTTEGSFWFYTFNYDIPENINNIEVVLTNLDFIVFVAENEQKIITGAKASIEFGDDFSNPTILASTDGNGTIFPSGEKIFIESSRATYTFSPKPDYEIDEVLINGEPVESDSTNYTFLSIEKNYTIHVTFKFKEIVGIEESDSNSISISPNPVNDKLFITGLYEKLEIFSLSGQLLVTAYNQPSVDVNHLAKGIYFVKIQSNGNVTTHKVVK
jgi:hypothetical protein